MMIFDTEFVKPEAATAYLNRKAADRWFVNVIQAVVVNGELKIFVASCQKERKIIKTGDK